jgi:sigma-B regulation protein RsbU (phosphoserine phosphatase)
MSFLPAAQRVTEQYEIFGFNQSSALVGGDYFDYFSRREQSVQCVVADACGHGMAAALIMTNFRGMLQAEVSRFEQFETLFTNLNRRLYTAGELVQYLTCVLFNYDEESRALQYFNAGHFDPVLVHTDGTTSKLPGGGPPLGMFDFSVYHHQHCRIRPGDVMILFTDGLVELRNRQDEFFGVDRVLECVRDLGSRPLREIAQNVLGNAAGFSGTREPDDDITLFLMRFH